MEKKAALIFGSDDGHLDHLAPFCSLYDIPLFLTSTTLFKAAQTQYEKLDIYYLPETSVCSTILNEYDALVSTLPKQLLDPLFFLEETLLQKKLRTYWLPHGSSDKKNMSALLQEEHLLIYGDKMKEMLPASIKEKTTFVGNFRFTYFTLHKAFLQEANKKAFP